MAFSASDIVSRITQNGLSRNNRFDMTFTIPSLLQSNPAAKSLVSAANDIRFSAEETVMPGVALITHAHRRYGYGPMEKRPYAAGFSQLQCMIRGDQDGNLYKFFAAWSRIPVNYEFRDSMSDPSGAAQGQMPYCVTYPSEYQVQATVTTYRDDGQPSITINLLNAYPEYFGGDVNLSWHRKNEYLRFPVVFTYRSWEMSDAAITYPSSSSS